MRTLPASQAALAALPTIAPVPLVHLTTFTNVGAETIEAEYWWTRGQSVIYEWDGTTARNFEDRIVDLSPIVRKMEHLPNGSLMDLRRTSLEIQLDPALWPELRTRNLLFARVEVALLLIPIARRQPVVSTVASAFDLRDLSNDHVFWFRGELTNVGDVTPSVIPLTFESREPQLAWPFSSVATEVDPRDLGKRYPIPIGKAKSVPVINRKIGWVTTLAQAIATPTSTGNHTVTDATGLSGSGIELQIGAERVTASFVNATTINLTARGQQGTQATAHNASETIVEILASNVLIFSGIQAKELDALYVISPLTGEKVLIPAAGYTKTLADTTTDSGRTLSTVSFTAAQFRAMIDSMLAVSQQPSQSVETVQLPVQAFAEETAPPRVPPVPGVTDNSTTRFVGPDAIRIDTSVGSDEAGKLEWTSDAGMPNPTAAVIRWRFVVRLSGLGGGADHAVGFRIHIFDLYGFSNGDGTAGDLLYTFDNGATEDGVVVASTWRTPGSAQVVNDAVGAIIRLYLSDEGGSGSFNSTQFGSIWLNDSYIEVETESELGDVAIAALSLGWGLQFVADVQGAQTAGVLHESMPDVMEWFIKTFAGLGAGAIDSPSFAQAETDLGANVYAGTLNLLGTEFAEVIAGLCFHGRCNVAVREGYPSPVLVTEALKPAVHAIQTPGPNSANLDIAAMTADQVHFQGNGAVDEGVQTSWSAASQLVNDTEEPIRFRVHLRFSFREGGSGGANPANTAFYLKLTDMWGVSATEKLWVIGTVDPNPYEAYSSWYTVAPGQTIDDLVDAGGAHRLEYWIEPEGSGTWVPGDNQCVIDWHLVGDRSFLEIEVTPPSPTVPVTIYRLLAAQANSQFPAAVRTLSEIREQTESWRQAPETATRFLGHYHLELDAEQREIHEADARELVRIDKDSNDASSKVATADLTTAEQRYGRRDAEPVVFPLIVDRNTAIDVLGYYAHETIRRAGRFGLTVPFSEGYDLELGDPVSFVPQGHSAAVKARVIQVSTALDEPHVGLNLEEVE